MTTIVNQTEDKRIVKLNEIMNVKMSSISSSKRPFFKSAKPIVEEILKNWDNLEGLKKSRILIKELSVSKIYCKSFSSLRTFLKDSFDNLLSSRIEELEPKLSSAVNIIQNKEYNLTDKELVLIDTLNESPDISWGELYSSIDCNDLAKILKWNVKSVKGVVGSLVKKNILGTYDTGTGFDVIVFVNQENMVYQKIDTTEAINALLNAKRDDTKKESVKNDKNVSSEKKELKIARKVGDVHPKHPTWVWTEYKTGKFDWRINNSKK